MVMLGSCCTRELWHLAAYSYFAGKSRLMAVGFPPLSDISQVGKVQPKREAWVDVSLAFIKVPFASALSPAWHIYGEGAMEPSTGETALLRTALLTAGNRSWGWVWEQKYSPCLCVCVSFWLHWCLAFCLIQNEKRDKSGISCLI